MAKLRILAEDMIRILLGKVQNYLPLIHVLILVLGTTLSSISSYFQGDVSVYLPFISETGAYPPGQCIFSLFLIFGSFIGLSVVFITYIMISSKEGNESNNFHLVNASSCIVGFIAMIGLAGVAAFPMTTVFWAHLLAAGCYFGCSAIYFLGITYLSYRMYRYRNTTLLTIRVVISFAMLLLLLAITVVFPIALKNWHQKNNEIIPARKEPHHEGFTLILVSSLLEWSIEILIIAFILTLMKEIRFYRLLVTVRVMDEPAVGRNEAAAPNQGY